MLTPISELLRNVGPQVRILTAAVALPESRQQPNSLVIDVREPSEVAAQPVSGSLNIPRGVLEMTLLNQAPNADTPIYIHCATGARATLSAEQLQRIGYRNVTVIGCPLDTLTGLCAQPRKGDDCA